MNGISSTNSTSKIKKTTAKIKNRKEKVSRELLSGSNPHSKDVSVSRVIPPFFLNNKPKTDRALLISHTEPRKKIPPSKKSIEFWMTRTPLV